MKNYIFLILSIILITSCSQYQKALKSTDLGYKLSTIDTLIKNEKYSKAVNLFDQVIPALRGTDSAKTRAFQYANALYSMGDYINSAYQFERFVNSHPKSEEREEAAFMSAKSHYNMASIYSKDQTNTMIGMTKLQDYINAYPTGNYLSEANELVNDLRTKLDRKAYEIAKNYHHRERYIPAIKGFENFIIQHPGSEYMDDAQFYLFDSQYQYAVKSRNELIKERLEKATKYYNTFVSRFPKSEYKEDADELKEKIEEFKLKNNI